MPFVTRRLASALIAAAVIGSMVFEDAAFAQAPTVGPAGGVATTTAPANGEGTPAGGTGTVQTTRVGPSTTAPAYADPGPRYSPTPAVRRRVRRRRIVRRPAATRSAPAASTGSGEVGTQSQLGTNGSVPPATR